MVMFELLRNVQIDDNIGFDLCEVNFEWRNALAVVKIYTSIVLFVRRKGHVDKDTVSIIMSSTSTIIFGHPDGTGLKLGTTWSDIFLGFS